MAAGSLGTVLHAAGPPEGELAGVHLHSACSRGPVPGRLYCGTMAETPCKLGSATCTRESVLITSQEPVWTQSKRESNSGDLGTGRRRGWRSSVISLGELQDQARPYTACQATPRRRRASGGWTKAGLEGPGEELEEALLCGHKGATERPGRQRWPWASGRLAWLWSTRGPKRGELVAWPAGVRAAMPGPVLPTPQAPLTRGFFHLGLSLSGPSRETPLTSPFPAILPVCGGRVAPQAGLWDSPSWPLSACRTPRLVPLLEVTAERRPNFLSVLPPPGPWFPKHPISPSGPSEPRTRTRGSSLLLLPHHGNP